MTELPQVIPTCHVRRCRKPAAERVQVEKPGWATSELVDVCKGHRHIYKAQAALIGATVTVVTTWLDEWSLSY